MEFWNDFSKTVGDFADITARETERLAAIARLKYRLRCQRSRLSSIYEQIGQLCYRERAGELDEESTEISELCEKAAELKTKILLTVQAIEAMKAPHERKANRCTVCGTMLRGDMSFCPKCGTRMRNEGDN